jgi:DNA-binding FadR family transcriptional regulator
MRRSPARATVVNVGAGTGSADLARLQEVLDRHRESIDDPGACFAADAEFHRLIVEMAGSETLQILVGMPVRDKQHEAASRVRVDLLG